MILAMNMDKTDPCESCPFRTDWDCHLNPEVGREMVDTLRAGGSIACWETVADYDDDGNPVYSEHEQHCAGALIMLEKQVYGPQTKWAKWLKKIGRFPDLNLQAPVYPSFFLFTQALEDAAALDRVAGMMTPVEFPAREEAA